MSPLFLITLIHVLCALIDQYSGLFISLAAENMSRQSAYFFPFLVTDEEPQQESWTPEGGRGDKESTIIQDD